MKMSAIVEQIIVGFARMEKSLYKATGSVSLIQSDSHLILVDCGDPWNGSILLSKLAELDIKPEQITDVIISHGHIDHCANINLFQNATVYMAEDYAKNGVYNQIKRGSPFSICSNVSLNIMKGHTDHDLVVIVESTIGHVIITGDLFECESDELDESWKLVSSYPEDQQICRKLIKENADWIIPGHGPMFKNNRT